MVARLMGKPQVEHGLRGTLQGILEEFLGLFDAQQAFLALQETSTGHGFLWEIARLPGQGFGAIRFAEIEPARQATYFFPSPADAWHLVQPSRRGGDVAGENLFQTAPARAKSSSSPSLPHLAGPPLVQRRSAGTRVKVAAVQPPADHAGRRRSFRSHRRRGLAPKRTGTTDNRPETLAIVAQGHANQHGKPRCEISRA